MGFFKLKKKEAQSEKSIKIGQNNKKDGLSTVLNESVLESALDIMSENEKFKLKRGDKTYFVCFLLDTHDVGGFFKDSKKDADKGSFLELVSGGDIDTLLLKEYLEQEKIIFIPNEQTLVNLDEYGFLKKVNYVAVLVDEQGDIEETQVVTTLDQIIKTKDVEDLFKGVSVKTSENVQEDEQEENDEDEDEEEESDIPFGSNEASDAPVKEIPVTPSPVEKINESQEASALEGSYDASDMSEHLLDRLEVGEEYEGEEEEYVMSEEDHQKAMVRKFYSDELGLEVDFSLFDAMFLSQDTLAYFDTDRSDSWIGNYLNELSREANTELMKNHVAGLALLREEYHRRVANACEEIISELSTTNENKLYCTLLKELKSARRANLDNYQSLLDERKAKLMSEWNEKVEEVGKLASIEAMAKYRERYGIKQNEKVSSLERDLKSAINDDYEVALRATMDDRRKEAGMRLDLAITKILQDLAIEKKSLNEQDANLYRYHRDRINEYLEEHRKDDVAQREVLAKSLAQDQKIANLTVQHTAELTKQIADFDARKQELLAQIDQVRLNAEERVREKSEQADTRVKYAQDRIEGLEHELNGLRTEYKELDSKIETRYKNRIIELENERESWENKCKHIMAINRKVSFTAFFGSIVLALLFGAIGIVIGLNKNFDAMVERFEQSRPVVERRVQEPAQEVKPSFYDNSQEAFEQNR